MNTTRTAPHTFEGGSILISVSIDGLTEDYTDKVLANPMKSIESVLPITGEMFERTIAGDAAEIESTIEASGTLRILENVINLTATVTLNRESAHPDKIQAIIDVLVGDLANLITGRLADHTANDHHDLICPCSNLSGDDGLVVMVLSSPYLDNPFETSSMRSGPLTNILEGIFGGPAFRRDGFAPHGDPRGFDMTGFGPHQD